MRVQCLAQTVLLSQSPPGKSALVGTLAYEGRGQGSAPCYPHVTVSKELVATVNEPVGSTWGNYVI